MTAGIKTSTRFNCRDLTTQIRDAVRRGGIGGRSKKTNDRVFADEIARPIEALHADIVEIDAPVHASMNVGLGDDEKMRLLQKRHDLRCDLQKFITAFEHAQLARA